MAKELVKCGVSIDSGVDWVKIRPFLKSDYSTSLVSIETYDDHRVAMSMAVFGSMIGNIEILDPDCVKKTYPGFWDDLGRVGGRELTPVA